MKFCSTRNSTDIVSGSEAILRGISVDGGLYVPEVLPDIYERLNHWLDYDYNKLTAEILSLFFDEFSYDDMLEAVKVAYDGKFEVIDNVKVQKFGKYNFLELYHGPTSAFKDMALCLLPQLMLLSAKHLDDKKKRVILTATSGDTGKAALEGFKGLDNLSVIVFYPRDGVSTVQEKQMLTTEGDNAHVISIEGNFDDAQNGVKSIFMDNDLKTLLGENNIELSSANSINIGRLVPQIVYYFYGYLDMVRSGMNMGERINISVPTGNFGNILAGYMAKKMGLPIELLVCGSNKNDVLASFFNSGEYDRNREFYLTTSPSMDILVSSNLERYLYYISNQNTELICELMKSLKDKGKYKITDEMKANMNDFRGSAFSDYEVSEAIKKVYKNNNYLMDTHTAIGYLAGNEILDNKNLMIVSTASPYKFADSVYESIFDVVNEDKFQVLVDLQNSTNTKIPYPLKGLKEKVNLHNKCISASEMKNEVKNILGV